jgi:hypothetical protein
MQSVTGVGPTWQTKCPARESGRPDLAVSDTISGVHLSISPTHPIFPLTTAGNAIKMTTL